MKSSSTRKALLALVAAILVVTGAELVSSQWQAGEDTAEERGIYQKSLTYIPPNDDSVSIQNLPIEEQQVGYLVYDRGRRLAILDREASRGMELLYLEYDGNSPRYFFDLFNHPPEICMASTGAQVTERYPDTTIEIEGSQCLVQTLKVVSPDTDESRFIFKVIWVHPDHPLEYGASIHLKRIQAAMATVPPPPSRLMMGGMYGFASIEEARAYFDQHVMDQLQLIETRS